MSDFAILFPIAFLISCLLAGLVVYKLKQHNATLGGSIAEVEMKGPELTRSEVWPVKRAVHRQFGFFPNDICNLVWDPVKQEFEYPSAPWPDWMVVMIEHECQVEGHEDHCFQCKGGWKGRVKEEMGK